MAGEFWRPGSFTKNFAWGHGEGLKRLHENIKIGFGDELRPVLRDEYRARVALAGRPDFIPINFFLFNYVENGRSYIAVDELVFQALTADHGTRFDKLAIFAFNFSYAGRWKGGSLDQRYPALWARNYVLDRIAGKFEWDVSKVSALDIRQFLDSSPQYVAETSGKVATNLNFLYKISSLSEFRSRRIERWWVDAVFLAIDRLVADRQIDDKTTSAATLPGLLLHSKFLELTGPTSPEKTFALAHLLSLYNICGGINRFTPEAVQSRTAVLLPNYSWQTPNDNRPQGALHPTNPRILKLIPRECSALATSAGFQIVYADDFEDFDPEDFVKKRAREAVDSLKRDGLTPTMSADDLHKLTRGE